MNILAISGSLQAGSSNTALLHALRAVAPDTVSVVVYESVEGLPHFNPDRDVPPGPPEVAAFRRLLAAADAVVIASPEYAHSLPGALKDALDWVVGSGELYAKPVALLSAAPSEERGVLGRRALEQTLLAQGARVVFSQTVEVLRAEERNRALGGEATTRVLREVIDMLAGAPTAPPVSAT